MTIRTTSVSRAVRGVGAGGLAEENRPRRHRAQRGVALTFWLLILPSAILLLIIHGYPLVYAAIQAVTNGNLVQAGQFVGLDNFVRVLTKLPTFWPAARFTLIFTIVGVFGSWILGLALALLIRRRVHASGLFKTLLLLPWVVPVVVSSTAWSWLVANPQSPIPMLFKNLGFGTVLVLADPTLAQITLCVFKVWISFPFMLLMMSSALTSVDNSVYEAAKVDGASSRQAFFQITLPLIARPTYVSWILMTIFCINDFTSVYLLTGGGPVNATTTLVVLAFQEVFNSFQTGPGVAIAFMMTIISVIISVVLYRQIRKVDIA